MRLVPETNEGRVNFYRTHIEVWTAHADALGLSGGRAEALAAILAEAEEAMRAQREAQQIAQSATQAMNNAIEKLSRYGAGALNSIRAAAVESGDNVFNLAMIPPPSRKKTTLGPPTTPDSFTAQLTNIGLMKHKWKCSSPRGAGGTMYKVSRQLNGAGPYEDLGSVGKKQFIDQTIPPGTTSVRYMVKPRRSTCSGDAGFHTVEFANNTNLPVLFAEKQAA